MKQLSRQDRNGTRTSEELRRRYQFKDIDYTKEEVEALKKKIITDDHLSITSTNPVQNKVITEALNNKVNKEEGKGLSSNDFTDELKNKLENQTMPTKVSELENDLYYATEDLIPTKVSDLTNDSNFIPEETADTKYCTNEVANKKVPKGGTTGQVLTKKSNSDNDTEWKDQIETTSVVPITSSDLNTKTGELIIGYGNECTNRPPSSQNGFLINLPHTGSPTLYNKQFWFNRMNNRAWTRSMENGVWTDWYSSEIISASIDDNEGYVWYANGTLEQWGRVSITPTAANTVTSATIKFPKAYDKVPDIDAIPQANTPNAITWSVGGGTTTDEAKQGMIIYATRTNTSATLFKWRAKGFKNP